MKKYITIAIIILIIMAGMFAGGWFAHSKYMKPPKDHYVYVKQKYGDKITVSKWKFDTTYGMFDVDAEGPGGAEVKFQRPKKWQSHRHVLLVNAVLGINHKRILYGGEIMYYYMLLNHVGIGGGVGLMANDNILQGDYEALVKAGLVFKW